MVISIAASTQLRADTGTCGGSIITLPFTDVASSSIFFCSIAEAFFSGLTNGTSATTYSPGDPVLREQMAAFTTRTMDQSLRRGSKRAALDQFWTPQTPNNLGLTDVGANPQFVKFDGADLWVPDFDDATITRVRASDGKLLETWTGALLGQGVLVAMGKVFVTGSLNFGRLYQIDPTQPAGDVTTLSTMVGRNPIGIAFDGQRIWTANFGLGTTGSVSIITFNPTTIKTVTTGFNHPVGILYDGTNIWVTDLGDNALKKLDSNGEVLQSVTVGLAPSLPAFDGTNIWVPNRDSNTVSVVRATGSLSGTVLATLSAGEGLDGLATAAFDGERILVTAFNGHRVLLWKASDLTPIGSFSVGAGNPGPFGACSDGINFWITLSLAGKLARF